MTNDKRTFYSMPRAAVECINVFACARRGLGIIAVISAIVLSFFIGLTQESPAETVTLDADSVIWKPSSAAPLSDWLRRSQDLRLSIARDGAILRGLMYKGADPSLPSILFVNSNGMTIDTADDFYKRLSEVGPTIYVFDYRGIGFSSGRPSLAAFQSDELAEYDFLAANHAIIVYGYSIGTAIATFLDTKRPLAGLILAAPIANAREEVDAVARTSGSTSSYELAPELVTALAETSMLKDSRTPLLVIDGLNDRLVAPGEARSVYTASQSRDKQIIEIEGASHFNLPTMHDALMGFSAFAGRIGGVTGLDNKQ